MSNLQIFRNNEFGEIRVIEKDGEPWLVGKDVANSLGYSNSRKAISDHVDVEDKGVTICDTPGGKQEMTIINESGFYSLVLSSKLPTAKKFKRWVTSEVLPSIRKEGKYIVEQTSKSSLAASNNNPLQQQKEKLKKAVITSNYLIDYIGSSNGLVPDDILNSFTTVIQAVNIDIIDHLRNMNKIQQTQSHH
ncbi:Bro-N domain-containing protein [Tissierella carlieri]|uniref:BRO-N domain-containing protein n=1 Tax=Tissierella carlieri TaxID=689904 RepID=UPI0038652895